MKKKQLIGILNCTPDSYFDKGRFTDPELAIEYGLRLFEEGADIVDIGGESTRPDSLFVDEAEEIKRVVPVIQGLRARTDKILSIDTYKPAVAAAAVAAGANWINDITALLHPQMRELVRKENLCCCLMHMYGPPHSQPQPIPRNVVADVTAFFKHRVAFLTDEGIDPSKMILDPGIGGGSFGKTFEECLQLIAHTKAFTQLGFPLLIGLSRKSFLQKILQKPPSEILSTTVALNTIALLDGASYLRVHDVAEHRDVLTILELLQRYDGISTFFNPLS